VSQMAFPILRRTRVLARDNNAVEHKPLLFCRGTTKIFDPRDLGRAPNESGSLVLSYLGRQMRPALSGLVHPLLNS